MSHADQAAPVQGADATADESFSAQIRRRSRAAHKQAEGEGFVDALFNGTLGIEDYIGLVTAHYFIYQALEEAGAGLADDPLAAELLFPGLEREAALAADLASLIGPDWQEKIAPSAVTAAYVDRIRNQAAASGIGYAAHAYTRYLGDLSGGQMIRMKLVKQFGFEGTDKVAFYDFPALGPLGAFKDVYRGRIDSLPLDEEGKEALIQEVLVAYDLNVQLFDELNAVRLARA